MWGAIGEAIAMFTVTNIDDILLLALYFGQARNDRAAERRIVLGQYLGFGGILVVSVLAAFGLRLLPAGAIPYLGLVPLALGLRAGVDVWRHRRDHGDEPQAPVEAPMAGKVAGVTFANGGDNIGVYVPVFTTAGTGGIGVYAAVFLVMVALWCLAGRFLATRPMVARTLARRGHVLLPLVLISIGALILIEGGAFGL